MTNNSAYTFWKGLPGWAKGTLAVGGALALYLFASQIVARIKSQGKKQEDKQAVDDAKDEISKLANSGIRQSYSETQYRGWADQIKAQFDGCDITGVLAPIDPTLFGNRSFSQSGVVLGNIAAKLKNDLDFLKLVEAYGVRTYDQCGIGTGDFTGNLYAAVSDELTSKEIDAINSYMSKKGITYKF